MAPGPSVVHTSDLYYIFRATGLFASSQWISDFEFLIPNEILLYKIMEQTMKVANNVPFPNQEHEIWNL